MSQQSSATVSAPFGDPKAPVESEPYALRWRVDLLGAIRNLDVYPDKVDALVGLGQKFRLWRFLKNEEGQPFSSFKAFCEAPEPNGLGTPERTVIAALETRHGKAAVQLATVPEPKSPPGVKVERKDNRNECGLLSPRTEQQLRAINRAPEAIREAYTEGRISQTLAAKLGRKNPSPDEAALVAEVANDVRKLKDRKAVDSLVREKLGAPKPTRVDKAMSLVRRMTDQELYDFEDKFNDFLGTSK